MRQDDDNVSVSVVVDRWSVCVLCAVLGTYGASVQAGPVFVVVVACADVAIPVVVVVVLVVLLSSNGCRCCLLLLLLSWLFLVSPFLIVVVAVPVGLVAAAAVGPLDDDEAAATSVDVVHPIFVVFLDVVYFVFFILIALFVCLFVYDGEALLGRYTFLIIIERVVSQWYATLHAVCNTRCMVK